VRHNAVGWVSVMVLIMVGSLFTACGTSANGAVIGIVRRQVGGPTEITSYPPAKVLVTQQGSLVKSETANSDYQSRSFTLPAGFRFSLPPGDYQVSAQMAKATCKPVSVTVRSSKLVPPLVITCQPTGPAIG
jgi:hypothetical protein